MDILNQIASFLSAMVDPQAIMATLVGHARQYFKRLMFTRLA
jgi:hypothetical protein